MRKWQRACNPEFKTCLNRLAKELNQEVQQIQNQTFTKYLTADKSTDYSLWKSTKNFKRPITQSPHLKTTHDKWAKSNTQIIFRAPGRHLYCQPIQYPHSS